MIANGSVSDAEVLKSAEELTEQGHFVIPVCAKTKQPRLKDWTKTRLAKADLQKHFNSDSNIGLLLGIYPYYLADVDLDCEQAVAAARLISGPETQRISGRPGNRTSHFFYSLPIPITKKKFQCPRGRTLLELRGEGHQTIVPPSIHPSGEPSEWERKGPFGKATESQVFDWASKLASVALLARHWPVVGRRHEAALALSGMLARARWSESIATQFIQITARIAGDDEWMDRGRTVISTFARAQVGDPTIGVPTAAGIFGQDVIEVVRDWLQLGDPIVTTRSHSVAVAPWTDQMNSIRFANQHRDSLRFCLDQNAWYAYDGRRWRSNDLAAAMRCAALTARSIYAEAQSEDDDVRRTHLAKWAVQSESRQRLDAMVVLGRFHVDIAVHSFAETFDRDPWLLNCENGLIDLRSGRLKPHQRDALVTKLSPVIYDPYATCPRWENFLQEITCGNQSLVAYLQRVAGYVLTGDSSEHVFFLLYAEGSNGKTTMVNVLAQLLGDYAHSMPFQEFILKRHDGGSNEIAQLQGVRFVYSMEAPVGRTFNEALLKQLSGGDKIRARALYRESVEWDMQGKLFFAANHRPEIRETTDAIWNRVQMIPFLAAFRDGSCDKELHQKLRAELSGILRWALNGCLQWQREGLRPPDEVIKASREYRAENDNFADFLRERCLADPLAHALARDIYKVYREWANQNGVGFVMSPRAVGIELGRRGFKRSAYKGQNAWRGIGLL